MKPTVHTHHFHDDAKNLLSVSTPDQIEQLAVNASKLTQQYFGRTISLYAPLYLSNYCDNACVYCGFNCRVAIDRMQLAEDEIATECKELAEKGIQNVLLLTGESRRHTSLEYMERAIRIASDFFPSISLEIFPMETDEYKRLYKAGADGVTIYQETYDRDLYAALHPKGRKRNYDFRFQAPERISEAGFRQVSLGVLLGLADWKQDVLDLYGHLSFLEKKYPGVEYGVSFPRLQPIGGTSYPICNVSDMELLVILCATRILFPRVGINLSTRETARFRDRVLGIGVTRISAGSSTKVGGYAIHNESMAPEQFSTHDDRSVLEIKAMIKEKGFDPVFTDWRHFSNE